LHGGEVVSPASYAAITTPGSLNDGSAMTYAFGLVQRRYRDRPQVGHNGGINGFVSSLVRWPQDDITVVVLSNIITFPADQVVYGLARRALGLPDVSRTRVVLDETRLGACAGRYRFEIGPLKLTALDGGLTSDWPRPNSRFHAVADEVFFLEKDPEVTLTFDELQDGAYQRLSIQGYGDPVPGGREGEPAA
jgi:hypothetical protein